MKQIILTLSAPNAVTEEELIKVVGTIQVRGWTIGVNVKKVEKND